MYGYVLEKIDVGHHWDLQGSTGPGLKASAAHFYPCLLSPPPVYFVRYENNFFFETLNSAFRTLQDVLLTCRVFSSSQKAIKEDS